MHDGWIQLMTDRAFLVKTLVLVAAQVVLEMGVVWTAWAAVGVALPPATLLLVTTSGILAALTGLTPNGLGVVELAATAVGASVAIEPTHAIAASLVARGATYAVLVVIAPFALAIVLTGKGTTRGAG